jgi:hypothetical protein
VTGANYVDGSHPALMVPAARSNNDAIFQMRTHGRAKEINLRWSKATYIRENLKFVLSPADHFFVTIGTFGEEISEMRAVRNRIAHSNRNSRAEFAKIVFRHYGGSVNGVTPGILLLSPRRSPVLLEQYISISRAIVTACSKP